MASEEQEKQKDVEALRSKLAQLEEQEALLEQIGMLKQEIAESWQRRDIFQAQSLYNRAWEMKRYYGKRFYQENDDRILTKEFIVRTARKMGFR